MQVFSTLDCIVIIPEHFWEYLCFLLLLKDYSEERHSRLENLVFIYICNYGFLNSNRIIVLALFLGLCNEVLQHLLYSTS